MNKKKNETIKEIEKKRRKTKYLLQRINKKGRERMK